MSRITPTKYGRFNHTSSGPLWECPKCGAWGAMSEDQLNGRVSVVCSGPSGDGSCDYHETHDYGPALIAAMQARLLTDGVPFDYDAVL